jgi:hypothetical protein
MRKEDFFDASSSQKKALKIGDRVRFLNNVGGGIVTAYRGRDQVIVEDENGFDVPVLIAECVVIGEGDKRKENKETDSYSQPFKSAILQNTSKTAFAAQKVIITIQKAMTTTQKDSFTAQKTISTYP